MDSNIEKQRALEARSVEWGQSRYKRKHDRADEADTKPGQHMADQMVDKLTGAIVAVTEASGAGRKSAARKYLELFHPVQTARITARVVLNAVASGRPATLTSTAVRIGTVMEDTHLLSELKKDEGPLISAGLKKAAKSTTSRHARAVMNVHLNAAKDNQPGLFDEGPTWAEKDKLLVGSRLIELLMDTSGLIAIESRRKGNKTPKFVCGTTKLEEWLKRAHDFQALLEPFHLPMVVPPKDWTCPVGGGYLSLDGQRELRLVKTRSKDTIDDLFSSDMPQVYDAVNVIQRTPWKINQPVYNLVRECHFDGTGIGGLVPEIEEELPPKPADINTNPDALAKWKAEAAWVYEQNARNKSKRLSLAQALEVAKIFKDGEPMYFPHQLDFRGRVYPTPPSLNPQADDASKSMLTFAEGRALGEEGAYWLAVHIANLFGEDKISLDDRVQWVEDNEEAILESGLNPLDGKRFWTQADKPFCALAACFEWVGYKAVGDDFVSHLPVAMDGSCSGLQHYSALLRDPTGGAAVNLVAADKPADIYTTVAERVVIELSARADEGDKLAAKWHGAVTRKIVKRPCMTYAYSATARGMRDQIIDEMRKQTEGNYIPGYRNFEAANYLAPIVRQCISDTVHAANVGMEWLKVATSMMTKEALPCVWTTPVGLPIIQKAMEIKSQRVVVLFDGKELQLFLAVETKKINGRKQTASIAPNFIHSMDAAHLMMTTLACHDVGINDFAMIHDSFGTHAANISALNILIREEFVAMYEEADWLDQLRVAFEELAEITLPETPEIGNLDLAGVTEAEYFFA